MRILQWVMIFISIFFLGCATNVRKASLNNQPLPIQKESTKKIVINITGDNIATESGDWEQLKSVWIASMKTGLRSIGTELVVQHGDPIVTSIPGTLVVIKVKDYRYISEDARFWLGAFIGNAYIDSVVGFFDLETGNRIGVRSYNTSSTAWEGIFSPMTEEQVQAICEEIIRDINHL